MRSLPVSQQGVSAEDRKHTPLQRMSARARQSIWLGRTCWPSLPRSARLLLSCPAPCPVFPSCVGGWPRWWVRTRGDLGQPPRRTTNRYPLTDWPESTMILSGGVVSGLPPGTATKAGQMLRGLHHTRTVLTPANLLACPRQTAPETFDGLAGGFFFPPLRRATVHDNGKTVKL